MSEPTGPSVDNPNEEAGLEEGEDTDIEPVGSELLELGEVLEWEKMVEDDQSQPS